MEFLVRFQTYERIINCSINYAELIKGIQKGFKFILKNNFTLHYFDEDKDKISICNQDDLDAISDHEKVEIIVEPTEEELVDSDDSFQTLTKSIHKSVTNFRKLSSSLNKQKQEEQEPEQIGLIKVPEETQIINYKLIESLQHSINNINEKERLRQQEVIEKEQKIQQKISKLIKPICQFDNLLETVANNPIIKQIHVFEERIDTLTKSELQSLNLLYRQSENIMKGFMCKRFNTMSAYKQQTKEYNSQLAKLNKVLEGHLKSSKKQQNQLRKLLVEYTEMLDKAKQGEYKDEVRTVMNMEDIEKQLDILTKKQIKENKQKKTDKQKQPKQKQFLVLGELNEQVPNFGDMEQSSSDSDQD